MYRINISSILLQAFCLFLLCKFSIQSTQIALENDFEIINGRIYIVYNSTTQSGTITESFYRAFSVVPNGVTLGIRSLKTYDEQFQKHDFNFQIATVSQVSFQMSSTISTYYTVNYTKLIVDYFTTINPNIYVGNQFVQRYYSLGSAQSSSIFIYENINVDNSDSNNIFQFFIHELTVDYNGKNFSHQIIKTKDTSTNMTITVKFPPDIVLDKIWLSYIVYNIPLIKTTYPNYQFKSETVILGDFYELYDLTRICYIYAFIGIQTISGPTSKKIDFDYGYVIQLNEPGYTLLDLHLDPPKDITMVQGSYPLLNYTATMFYYLRVNCEHLPATPILVRRPQLCISECYDYGFYVTPTQCDFCWDALSYCYQCYNQDYLGIVRCTFCYPYANTFLYNYQCFLCPAGAFYNSTSMSCGLNCSDVLPGCSKCSVDAQQCLDCATNTFLEDGICKCNSDQAYDLITLKCEQCNLVANCLTCSSSGTAITCVLCSTNFKSIGSLCVPCDSNQSYDLITMLCEPCNNISNCISCSSSSGVILCSQCSNNFQLIGNDCIPCRTNQYFNISLCIDCEKNCSRCNSNTNCLECETGNGIQYNLIDGVCVQIAILRTDSPVQCLFSQFNHQTNKCSSPKIIQNLMQGFTYAASIPTVNLITGVLSSLFGFLDDLSYYQYHKRNYSRVVSIYFGQFNNFTLFRWIPKQITQFYHKFDFTYSDKIMTTDLRKTPPDFQNNDVDIYFIKTTEKFWTSTLPFSLLTFLILGFIHYITNKYIHKNKMLKRYNYFGMLIVSLLGENIQYLSFRFGEQFFQRVPLGPVYYGNLIFCYIVFLLVILYSVVCVNIFQTIYSFLKTSYILEEMLGGYWIVRFTTYNILKVITGFVHSYFYYQQHLQTLFLLLLFAIKALLYLLTIRRSKDKLQYVVDMIGLCLLVFLQGFLFAQLFIIKGGNYGQQAQSYFGGIQSTIIIIAILAKIVCLSYVIVSGGINLIISIFKAKHSRKQHRILRTMMSQRNRMQTFKTQKAQKIRLRQRYKKSTGISEYQSISHKRKITRQITQPRTLHINAHSIGRNFQISSNRQRSESHLLHPQNKQNKQNNIRKFTVPHQIFKQKK